MRARAAAPNISQSQLLAPIRVGGEETALAIVSGTALEDPAGFVLLAIRRSRALRRAVRRNPNTKTSRARKLIARRSAARTKKHSRRAARALAREAEAMPTRDAAADR